MVSHVSFEANWTRSRCPSLIGPVVAPIRTLPSKKTDIPGVKGPAAGNAVASVSQQGALISEQTFLALIRFLLIRFHLWSEVFPPNL